LLLRTPRRFLAAGVSKHAMMKIRYILVLLILSFSVKGQDTIFYQGTKPSDKTKYNRFEIENIIRNTISKQSYFKKGGNWFKSEVSDSVVILNDTLIHKYYKFYGKVTDSTVFRIHEENGRYVVREFYDNNTLKFIGYSKKNFPFDFSGKASCFYRNGRLYENHFYSLNHIDSIEHVPLDTIFKNYVYENRCTTAININEFTREVTKNLNFTFSSESSIISTFYFAVCFKNGKIEKYDIIRQTEFDNDNELLRAIEKTRKENIFSNEINGCIAIPLRIDFE